MRVTPPSVWVALAAFAVLHAVQLPIPQCRQDGFGLVLPKLADGLYVQYKWRKKIEITKMRRANRKRAPSPSSKSLSARLLLIYEHAHIGLPARRLMASIGGSGVNRRNIAVPCGKAP